MRDNPGSVSNWVLPFLAATVPILLLNLALLEQRRRARRDTWSQRLLRELRAWDGRLPAELDRETPPLTQFR